MTPRRILLTIIALLVFGTAYSAYDRFLGWIDGLPILPQRMLAHHSSTLQPPARNEPPTVQRLREAFGDNCPEQETAFYPTQLQFFNGDTSTVVATGRPPTHPNSTKVHLSPFSVAVFGKPRPEHLRQPGEVVEITTFHSDRAILEFDKPIMTPTDMNSAKLVRLELISDPENTIPDSLGRRGYVHIQNNQRSADPNRRLQLKTIGPVFYRDTTVFMLSDRAFTGLQQSKVPDSILSNIRPLKDREFWREDFVRELTTCMSDKELDRWKSTIVHHASISPNGTVLRRGPDIWTDTAIQVIDFSNLPHHEGVPATTSATVSEELRNPQAVADILLGERLPPPTVTAVGMRVHLIPDDPNTGAGKKGSTGFSGLRRIELLEQVVMHFWMEAGSGMVGSEGKSSAIIEAPLAATAGVGGLAPAIYAVREFGRDLMQIETRGPFSFDAEKNLARYEVLPQADPNLTNDVRASKIPPRPGLQTLYSQVLELEFNGSPMGGGGDATAKPAQPAPGNTATRKDGSGSGGGGQFKRLHAFTTSPGRQVSVFSDSDQIEAYGQDLVRVSATEMTQFTGSPLYIVQQRSVIQAGAAGSPGVLTSESVEGSGGKWFKFTDQTASGLKSDRVPEAVAAKLAPLKNKKLSRDEFSAQMAKLLTEEELKLYQARLMKHAAVGPDRRTLIQGAGRFELYDAAAKANTMAAAWKTSLLVTKDQIGDRDFDLYTFTDDAKLEDLQSDWRLQGKIVKLWMAPAPPEDGAAAAPRQTATGPASPSSRSQIDRLEARGDVTSHSADLDIKHTDLLNVLFTDVPPPPPAAGEAKPAIAGAAAAAPPGDLGPPVNPAAPPGSAPGVAALPPAPAAPAGPDAAQPGGPLQPKEPEKPKPPMQVWARTIDSIVGRYPQPKTAPGEAPVAAAPPAAGEKGTTSGGVKYQLKSARCEGMVTAHQDPDDPAKPRGTDIHGSLMIIDSEPQGSRLTVMGWDFPDPRPGEVHNEETSLIGPKVFIDQLHNIAMIEGRGSVVLPGDSDLSGNDKKPAPKNNPAPQEKKPEPVVIHFRDGMVFEGTNKLAQFTGKVSATQGDAFILCHEMKVNMDKPVYFSQVNRPAAKPASGAKPGPGANPTARPGATPSGPGTAGAPEEEKAKIDVIYCYPAPADGLESPQEKQVVFKQIDRDPETGKPVRQQMLFARELTIRAQVKDDSRADPYRMVLAEGPGVTRIWAPESQEDETTVGQGKQATASKQPANQKPADPEMKLTVINFSGRMIAKDKGESYKEATFLDNIQVVNFPTENPDVPVEFYKLPLATVRLNCTNKLVVWTHKNPRRPDDPATQYMHAFGNAFLQNEKYDGWGEVIRSEGKTVWFDGSGQVPARIKDRFKATENSGQMIRLDRGENQYHVRNSIGGTFIEGDNFDSNRSNQPSPAKPTTPPPTNNGRGNQQSPIKQQ
jgi:hypothetical protein